MVICTDADGNTVADYPQANPEAQINFNDMFGQLQYTYCSLDGLPNLDEGYTQVIDNLVLQ
jgi:hypothetical protein